MEGLLGLAGGEEQVLWLGAVEEDQAGGLKGKLACEKLELSRSREKREGNGHRTSRGLKISV